MTLVKSVVKRSFGRKNSRENSQFCIAKVSRRAFLILLTLLVVYQVTTGGYLAMAGSFLGYFSLTLLGILLIVVLSDQYRKQNVQSVLK